MAKIVPTGGLRGYPKLARLMGPYPDIAIFRRFGSLTMLNLMRLQAELLVIEEKLRSVQAEISISKDPDINSYCQDFQKINSSQPPNDELRSLMEDSHRKLEQYNNLLLQAAQVTKLSKPNKASLKFLREWLIGKTEGDNFQKGLELLRTWDERMTQDLIALAESKSGQGDFSSWFKPAIITAYDWLWQSHRNPIDDESGQVYNYEDSKFLICSKWIVTLITTAIASMLPALLILWLANVEKTVTRIWITIGFTGILGLLMKIATNANMKEIFAATVAFAAVEVVFIGSANGN